MTFKQQMARLRIALAKALVNGLGYDVADTSVLRVLRAEAISLQAYVETSGGLNTPHRINAYRRVINYAKNLKMAALKAPVAI